MSVLSRIWAKQGKCSLFYKSDKNEEYFWLDVIVTVPQTVEGYTAVCSFSFLNSLIKSRIGVRAFTFKTSAPSLDLRDATFKIRVKALFFDKGFDQRPSLPS